MQVISKQLKKTLSRQDIVGMCVCAGFHGLSGCPWSTCTETPCIWFGTERSLPQEQIQLLDLPWLSHEAPKPILGMTIWYKGIVLTGKCTLLLKIKSECQFVHNHNMISLKWWLRRFAWELSSIKVLQNDSWKPWIYN